MVSEPNKEERLKEWQRISEDLLQESITAERRVGRQMAVEILLAHLCKEVFGPAEGTATAFVNRIMAGVATGADVTGTNTSSAYSNVFRRVMFLMRGG